jgi:hypothetical protein
MVLRRRSRHEGDTAGCGFQLAGESAGPKGSGRWSRRGSHAGPADRLMSEARRLRASRNAEPSRGARSRDRNGRAHGASTAWRLPCRRGSHDAPAAVSEHRGLRGEVSAKPAGSDEGWLVVRETGSLRSGTAGGPNMPPPVVGISWCLTRSHPSPRSRHRQGTPTRSPPRIPAVAASRHSSC